MTRLRNEAARDAAPAVVIGLVVVMIFIGKAFTIDDVTFLLQAQHLLKDPLHPTAFEMVFHGERIRLSSQMVSGPVMAYLLLPTVLLGGAEWTAHLVQAGFLAAGAMATSALALRLGLSAWQARFAALSLVCSPAVLAMSTTAMPDVPAMALGVAAMERLVAWRQTCRRNAALMAGLLFALAALARPHAVLLMACAAIFLLMPAGWNTPEKWPHMRAVNALTPVFVGFMATLLITFVTRDPASGDNLAGTAASRLGTGRLWVNIANFPLQWAVSYPLALAWPLLEGCRFLRSAATWFGMAIGLGIAFLGGYLPLAPLVMLGTAVLADALATGWSRRDQIQWLLTTWLLLGAAGALYPHLPAKYLVVSAPAMAILLARHPWERVRHRFRLLATIGIAGIVLGLLIIQADAAQAAIGRLGGRIAGDYVRRGDRVWLDGAWGFQWYAMKAGAAPMSSGPPLPIAGDIVVASLQARLVDRLYSDPEKSLLSSTVFDTPGGRILGKYAGFYVSGPLPWVWSRDTLGKILVWRIDMAPEGRR